MVMRALSGSARDLVDAEVCRVVSMPIEKLARSQALFLYQIIRLFDGDVALRAQGEKDMGLLKTWLDDLCHIRNNLGDLARLEYATVREQPSIEWEVRFWYFVSWEKMLANLASSPLRNGYSPNVCVGLSSSHTRSSVSSSFSKIRNIRVTGSS